MMRVSGMFVFAIACGLWLAHMIAAGYFSCEHRLPVRIENWKPEPAR